MNDDPAQKSAKMKQNLNTVKAGTDAECSPRHRMPFDSRSNMTWRALSISPYVKEMARLLKKGGLCIWIAPAGGRDRRGADGRA